MQIAILSDVHDQQQHLQAFLDDIASRSIDHILHLGDYGAPWLSIKPLLACGVPVTGVWGNNDGEKRWTTNLFATTEGCEILSTVYGQVTLWSRKIFLVHYDDLHEIVAKSGEFDLVLYGHNHLRDLHTFGETIVCNPGSICGNKQSPSYALYDTQAHRVVHQELAYL